MEWKIDLRFEAFLKKTSRNFLAEFEGTLKELRTKMHHQGVETLQTRHSNSPINL